VTYKEAHQKGQFIYWAKALVVSLPLRWQGLAGVSAPAQRKQLRSQALHGNSCLCPNGLS
jgi:hypothetical protein